MIGYRISRKDLEKLIEAAVPGWLARAALRTAGFKALGAYQESSSIWSEVKAVYMKLQGGAKCAFCERKLESVDFGKGEQAVEHFRPKGNIRPWKLPAPLTAAGVALAKTPLEKGGYFLLAYDLFNYSAACNPCNSVLKRDYFPVAKAHTLNGDCPEKLAGEQPLLLYPIGDFDDNPEDLIRFHGMSPQPVAASGHARYRALVTIEFFQLDSLKRKNLTRDRVVVIVGLYSALETLAANGSATRKAQAKRIVDGFTAPEAPHANCARSFCALHARDRAEAARVLDGAVKLLHSIS